MQSIQAQVAALIEQEPNLRPVSMAQRLNVSELEVVKELPASMALVASPNEALEILQSLVEFGPLTSIIHAGGSIFEIKAPFPAGIMANGYYNLQGENGQLHGHIKLESIENIALVSKPFMGKDSHYIGFFDNQGASILKVYLGRDDQRNVLPSQVEKFAELKYQLSAHQ